MKSKRIDELHGNGFNPANRGRTYSDNPKDPLWKISVTFANHQPLKELIKAPTAAAAKDFAQLKYVEATSVIVLGKARPGSGALCY